jgi:flagellar biogenesis protein FliO
LGREGFGTAEAGTRREIPFERKVAVTIVGILIVVILILLAIYLFQRVR